MDFFTNIVKLKCLFEKTKINKNEAGVGPSFKKNTDNQVWWSWNLEALNQLGLRNKNPLQIFFVVFSKFSRNIISRNLSFFKEEGNLFSSQKSKNVSECEQRKNVEISSAERSVKKLLQFIIPIWQQPLYVIRLNYLWLMPNYRFAELIMVTWDDVLLKIFFESSLFSGTRKTLNQQQQRRCLN